MFLRELSFRLLPASCLLCGVRSGRVRDLCAACERDLPIHGHACRRCAMPLPASGNTCGRCLRLPPPHDALRSAFTYRYPLDALIQQFKFHGNHPAGRVLGDLFAEHLAPPSPLPDCLLPVPLHVKRLRERGFNQSLLLAQALSMRLRVPLAADLVIRQRETAVQSGMNARARRRNVRDAFALADGRLPTHVAIVDDVVTTGSTTAEIAALLRRAGVERIEVWTLARAVM